MVGGSTNEWQVTMSDDRDITLTVAYEREPRYGRSLEFIAPELIYAGLTLTEDHADASVPSRTWAGVIDASTLALLARALHLEGDDEPAEPKGGRVPDGTYTFDGMNWEIGGDSPIVYVSVLVGVDNARFEADADAASPAHAHT